MAFTAKDVMALREKTGAGVMDCKKALTDADGDMDKAVARIKKAIENKEFSLFEGNVVFEEEDLKELKKLLQHNLPVTDIERYEVKEPIKENEQ